MTVKGKLSIVSTPIGNLEDLSFRALRILKEADLVLAEDTRRTKTLFSHYSISTPLRAYHAHSSPGSTRQIVEELVSGKKIALVSDAGTPLLSDPGQELVQLVAEQCIELEAIPGASAISSALAIAAMNVSSFTFFGFLPRNNKRNEALAQLQQTERACVFFESPQRIRKTLQQLAEIMPERRVAVCREMTKAHEEVIRANLTEICEKLPEQVRGEITVVLDSYQAIKQKPDLSDPLWREKIQTWSSSGQSTRDIAQLLAKQTGISRKECYQTILALQPKKRSS